MDNATLYNSCPISSIENYRTDQGHILLDKDIKNNLCLESLWNETFQNPDIQYKTPSRQSSTYSSLKWVCSLLSQSETLCALMMSIESHQWRLTLAKDTADSYVIDEENNLVVLPSIMKKSYSHHNLILNTIRALRDIWHEDCHSDLYQTLTPEEYLKWEKIRAADIESFTLLIAWELRISGENDLWRMIIGSEIGDMALVFQANIEQNKNGVFSYQRALLSTFHQWYREEDRVNQTDSQTLTTLDEILLDHSTSDSFGTERLKALDIEERLSLSTGESYLLHIENILNNPDYCQISSEVNQAHFFHIMNDCKTIHLEHTHFRDKALAAKIFPQE